MKARLVLIVKFVLLGSFFSVIVQAQTKKRNKQTIKITFNNKVNQQHVILDSAQYINYLNETFTSVILVCKNRVQEISSKKIVPI